MMTEDECIIDAQKRQFIKDINLSVRDIVDHADTYRRISEFFSEWISIAYKDNGMRVTSADEVCDDCYYSCNGNDCPIAQSQIFVMKCNYFKRYSSSIIKE